MIDFSREAMLEDVLQETFVEIMKAPRGVSRLERDYSKEDKQLLAEIEKDMFECPPDLSKRKGA